MFSLNPKRSILTIFCLHFVLFLFSFNFFFGMNSRIKGTMKLFWNEIRFSGNEYRKRNTYD